MTRLGQFLPALFFNPVSARFLKEPSALYDKLRSYPPVFWSALTRTWVVSSYVLTEQVLKDIRYVRNSKVPRGFELWMINQEPPDHTRLRVLANKAFTPTMIENLRPSMSLIAERLLDGFASTGKVDLISQYAAKLPEAVIAEMLGIPMEKREMFGALSVKMADNLSIGNSRAARRTALSATREFIEYLRPLVEERRRNPQSDLISRLVQAEEGGQILTVEELLSNISLLFFAGHETTINLIGNAFYALMNHPDQLVLVKSKGELMPQAINECLRFDPPVQLAIRYAQCELELGGRTIKKGNAVILMLGAANRDVVEFTQPDRLDIMRQSNKHLAFGAGIHYCLGAALARAEAEVALSALLKRFPTVQIVSQKVEYKPSPFFRGLKSLMVSV